MLLVIGSYNHPITDAMVRFQKYEVCLQLEPEHNLHWGVSKFLKQFVFEYMSPERLFTNVV